MVNEHESEVLLVSGFGPDGGGLASFDGLGVKRLDELGSTGICAAGEKFVRFLRSEGPAEAAEMTVYGALGLECRTRIEELSDAHEIVWDGRSVVVSSSYLNAIFWLSLTGQIRKKWQAPGELDSWHINGLFHRTGSLFASAFGKFENFREWDTKDGKGIIFDVATGKNVVSGLTRPHDPSYFDGGWTVCNSGTSELLQFDESGRISKLARLPGMVRGLTYSKDFVYVGLSLDRNHAPVGQTSSVAILSRETWEIRETVSVPFQEIFALDLVPLRLIEGLDSHSSLPSEYWASG